MPRQIYFMVMLVLAYHSVCAQQPDFATVVSPIIYKNCTPCHRPSHIGPMPFTNYDEVKKYARMIEKVISTGYMPPWRADTSYRSYANQITLTAAEVNTISAWIKNGMLQGNRQNEKPWNSFLRESASARPSLSLCMEQAYEVKGNNKDNYREFVIPLALDTTRHLTAVRFQPGNTKAVHHAWIYFDVSGMGRRYDTLDAGYGYDAFARMGEGDFKKKIPGYLPGMIKYHYPDAAGVAVSKETDLVIQIHYAPSAKPEKDSSCVELYFADKPIEREVQFLEITELFLTTMGIEDLERGANNDFTVIEKHLFIPANEKKSFTEKVLIKYDISLVSIIPHMHYRGTRFTSFAVTAMNDTIPLLRITDWDFDWQSAYIFKNLVFVPAGSFIYVIGEFDNTAENPSNPVIPPIDAKFGFSSKDEMLEMIIEYLPYQSGDEYIIQQN